MWCTRCLVGEDDQGSIQQRVAIDHEEGRSRG